MSTSEKGDQYLGRQRQLAFYCRMVRARGQCRELFRRSS